MDLTRALARIPGLKLKPEEPLGRFTTFRIGGPAELLVEVGSQSALVKLLRAVHASGAPFFLLGLGSNVLFPDAGVRGVVARLGGELRRVRVRGDLVSVGGALPLGLLARRMAARGLVGLEAIAGFPSTVGGAVCMNAGSYGTEIKDVLVRVSVVERDGTARRLDVAAIEPRYRATNLQQSGAVVTRAVLRLGRGDSKAAVARIDELNRKRWASLPSGQPNAGSIFRNPPGDYAGRLLEQAGMKGQRRGAAEVSPKHANVIVNTGGATAADVLALMVEMHRAVAERFAVRLEPEIVLVGELRQRWAEATAG